MRFQLLLHLLLNQLSNAKDHSVARMGNALARNVAKRMDANPGKDTNAVRVDLAVLIGKNTVKEKEKGSQELRRKLTLHQQLLPPLLNENYL